MIMRDLHVHTNFCDGKNSPEEMVIAAIDVGMECIGFSAHSYTFFDESYCLKKERTDEYRAEINRLKEKYLGRIEILCGIEQDYYSDMPTEGYDFVIGSVHYLKNGEVYIPVDERRQILCDAVKKYYGGDFYAMAEEYYRTVSDVAGRTNADIIGHFDLVSKFNEGNSLFDESDERYVHAYRGAVDKLIDYNIPFEINTGAISRGYRSVPYPAVPILDYIRKKGGKTILTSDSHSTETLCYQFDKWENI